MTMTVTRQGINEDGTPHYSVTGADHVVWTGNFPMQGSVTCQDGTTYDVSPTLVAVASPEHATEVAVLIGDKLAAEGHPVVPDWAEQLAASKKGKK